MAHSIFTSVIEDRAIGSQIDYGKGLSLLDEKACDPAYVQKLKPSRSRAKSLLKKMPSLKQAFIMSVIFQKFGE
jgi:hypothetical protein